MLTTSPAPLCERYDLALLDLDGVVYIGPDAVPGAVRHLHAARREGLALAYVTNNAARPPEAVAEHLRELGLPAEHQDVVTSAQAAARLLAGRLPPGSPVFVIGGAGLVEALRERGLRPSDGLDEEPAAVVSGYGPDLRWSTVSQGSILVGRGLPWVVANADWAVPTVHGSGPGNGVLVDAVARFTGCVPEVAGKPRPPLFEETLRRVGGERPLVVGDRLDTDIEGAHAAGMDSLLVTTGVTGVSELAEAPHRHRPSYVATGLHALAEAQPAPTREGDTFVDRGWRARCDGDRVEITGGGTPDAWWRVLAAGAWDHQDRTGREPDTGGLLPPR